jgi:hypothetical protein
MTAHAKKYFRPTLETLENREMMDAGIGGAVMHPMMPDIAQGAQIRLLTQETSALQNQNNPLSQALTQANQAFVAQSQQLNANVRAAADRIFSTWSHHVDQVVHNIPGLQGVANRTPASAPRGDHTRDVLESQMRGFLRHEFMNPLNGWKFRDSEMPCVVYTPSQDGNRVEMSFRLKYLSVSAKQSHLVDCNVWLVFDARTEGGEKVFSLTGAGLWNYGYNSDRFEVDCKNKFHYYFGSGIHMSTYNPSEVDRSNVVRAASSQFMRDIVGSVIPNNDWNLEGLHSATGTIEGSTIHVDLAVGIRKWGIWTSHTFRLSFQMDHYDKNGGKCFKIVGFQCDNDIDGKETLRDKVIRAFTDSPVHVGNLHPMAAKDVADMDLSNFKKLCLNEGKNAWGITDAKLDSWYADIDHLYVCIKLTRVNWGAKQPYESTLVLDHRYVGGGNDGCNIFSGSSATVETYGQTDVSLGVLTTLWTVASSSKQQRSYDKDGRYQGDNTPPRHAALEAQARSAPAVQETAAPLAGLPLQTSLAPPGASSPGAAKPADGATGLNDLTSSGLTDAYFISLGQQERKEA